ncbi:MAG: trimethylamine methyltransferase family protein [Anaerolineae bacterium]|nr:trimethylamine methyltransferase family protein [Anaerolineae bacterium]
MRPTIEILPAELITRIVDEAVRVLAQVGIEVRGPQLRARLLHAGLQEDAGGQRVLFPEAVTRHALAAAPSSITLYDREGKPHATLADDRVHFVPGSSGLNVVDRATGFMRPARTCDFVDYVRLTDGLEHIAYLATAFSTDDVPVQIADAWRLYLCLTNSRKPVVSGAFTEHGVPRMAEMMALFRRDRADLLARPLSIFTITASGNFRYSEDSCQNLLDCVEWGIPVEIVPVTLMGLVAPVSLVGAAVFHTVDVLAGVVMAQLVRPGAAVLFGGAPAAFHMGEATSPMTAIEAMRLDLAYAAIGKHLGLPTQTYLGMSENRSLDAQAGAESFGGALLAALAGINSVSGPGMLDYTSAFSLSKLVLDNELCGQALQFVRDTGPLDDLPIDELVAVQLAEGNLLTADHTLAHWRDVLHLPGPVYDRKSWDAWSKAGSKTLIQRADDEVGQRLAAWQPVETDPAIDREMRRLLAGSENWSLPKMPVPPAPATRQTPTRRRGHRRL